MLRLIAVAMLVSILTTGTSMFPAAGQQGTPCPGPTPAELEALAVA